MSLWLKKEQVSVNFYDSAGLKGNLHYKETGIDKYEGWNFNSGNYLFTTDIK